MNIEFNSQQELYQRIKPALYAKKCDMIRSGHQYIQEEDIWNYFKELKWLNAESLSLHEMVADILNVDNYHIDQFLKEKLNREKRPAYFNN